MQTLEKNLWGLLKKHLPPQVDVQRIETGGTGRNIPDVNMCDMGREFWVELKIVEGTKVKLTPEQVAWHYRRTRVGGTTWILARDKFDKVRKGKGDQMYLWPGRCAPDVKEHGIYAEGGTVWAAPYLWPHIVAAILKRDL